MKLDLLLTPFPLEETELEDKAVVVIDILRSSTSICTALEAGARGVIPIGEVGDAGDLWARLGAETAVLAGERNGVRIENFQYGNSPAEFTPATVGDKNLILCTTNGTGIFARVGRAAEVVSGALVNISALARWVAERERNVVVVCAGRQGGFSIEDTLCGGMLVDGLSQNRSSDFETNDAGSMARLLYNDMRSGLRTAVAQGEHGRFLESIGLGGDIDRCTAVDAVPIVPVLDDGRLVAAEVPSDT